MDARKTRCYTCNAAGEYSTAPGWETKHRGCHAYQALVKKGTLLWKRPGTEYSEPWDLEERGTLPTLCVKCAEARCATCGR